MREELAFHVERRAEDLIRSGLDAREARRRAKLDFGAQEKYKEDCREARRLRLWDEVRQDLVYALRTVRANPGFTAVAVLSLGLGIGANVAIFSLLNAVILKSLPVARPGELFLLH
ncbi:MAG: hypothetical protein JOZ62_14200, partial [Acidobacteriaceae bacterium]|nr:hypothetical protein [Acidobacteriaceae bacterium]